MDMVQQPPMTQGGLEQSSISLSAQAELELELSLRGSLLVQQQRRIVQLEDELQRAWSEIERLRTKLGALERERTPNDEDGSRQPRYWTPEEHTLFVEAVQRYGWKDVKAISQHVGTRNPTQVRERRPKAAPPTAAAAVGRIHARSRPRARHRLPPPLPPTSMPALHPSPVPSRAAVAPREPFTHPRPPLRPHMPSPALDCAGAHARAEAAATPAEGAGRRDAGLQQRARVASDAVRILRVRA